MCWLSIREDGQAAPAPHVAAEWLEIGDDGVDLRALYQGGEFPRAGTRAPRTPKVLGYGTRQPRPVVHIRDSPAEDLGDVEVFAQVGQPAIKRSDVHAMPASL